MKKTNFLSIPGVLGEDIGMIKYVQNGKENSDFDKLLGIYREVANFF